MRSSTLKPKTLPAKADKPNASARMTAQHTTRPTSAGTGVVLQRPSLMASEKAV
ncbi:hypothetical protein D3C87_2044070 [compost metagenome]